ncbi:MAG: O-antigen ligase family protein, partial [Lentisphaeria bacterium]|nr:O-antigen ligase family protein [Lentisphaeria bacterium]
MRKPKRHTGFSRLKRKFRRRLPDFLESSAHFPFYGTLGLLFVFSLCYAGGGHWWLPSALGCTYLLVGFWFLNTWWRGGSRLNVRFHAGLLLFLLPLVAGLIQLLPLGRAVRLLSPVAWHSWTSFEELGFASVTARLTMAPDATWFKCQLLLLCLLVFFLLYNFARHRHNLMLIMATITAAALGNALIAYWQFFALQSGAGLQTVFAGNFANRNHFGFMMSLGILAALGLLSCIKKDADRRMPHQPAWLKMRIPLIFSVFLLVIAQVLSLSRGAFLSSCIMICAYVTLWWLASHASSEGRKIVSALFILLLGALLFSLQTGLSMLVERYETLLEQDVFDTDTRISFWKDTVSMANEFPLTGAGLGAFSDTFQRYESGKSITVLADHAHNDWLELLSEMGWPLTLILIAGLFFLLIQAAHRLWRQQDPTLRWLGFAAMAAILAGMIHECFDFNLQAMSNAILFSALIAVLCSCARKKSADRIDLPPALPEYSPLHPRRLVFLLPAAFILIAILPKQIQRIQAAVINDRLKQILDTPESFRQPRGNDYLRWIQWADKALDITPDSGRLHFRKAICALRLAELEPDSAAQHWRTALSESATACQRFPNKGEMLLDTAEIHEAGAFQLGLSLQQQILALYRRAYECHPRLLPTMLRVADAYRRLYWQLLADRELAEEAEALRQQALSLFSEFLQLTPHRADEVFGQLAELTDNEQDLLKFAPKNLLLQQKLLEYFSRRQRYDMAFQLLEDNKNDWLEGPECESSPGAARDWYEWKYTLLGLTQQWDLRQQLVLEFRSLALRCLEKQIPPIPVNADTALLQQSELTLATLIRQPPRSSKVLLRQAEWMAHFGRHSEICTGLLPMTYAFSPQPLEDLEEALTLISASHEQDENTIKERERFLIIALKVCIAEQKAGRLKSESAVWLQTLRDLEELVMA